MFDIGGEGRDVLFGGGLCTKSPCPEISLCNLCVLGVSVVRFCSEFINHRDTENTEMAQRSVTTNFVVGFDRPVDASGAGFYPPSLELIEKDSGRTALHVEFVKLRP